VVLYPEYDFKEESELAGTEQRTADGSLFTYYFGNFRRFKFGVRYLSNADKVQVNSWWGGKAVLQAFTHVNCTDVSTMILLGKKTPVDRYEQPYTDLFRGTIELSTY